MQAASDVLLGWRLEPVPGSFTQRRGPTCDGPAQRSRGLLGPGSMGRAVPSGDSGTDDFGAVIELPRARV